MQPQLDVDRFFSCLPVEPAHPGHLETTLCGGLGDDVYLIYYTPPSSRITHAGEINVKTSRDWGRTWSAPRILVDKGGEPILGSHITMLRLKSGRLGLVYASDAAPLARTGRDGGTLFRTSSDEGDSWSEAVAIEPRFGICCSGHALVLTSGRVVVPLFRWISPDPSGDAENWSVNGWDDDDSGGTLSYCYCYVSDDEGETWQISLSELFISRQRAAFDLEEPTIVELTDGRLLMHMRSQVGRIYRSFSADGGICWSSPQPVHIAAAYTPQILRRMPGGEILMIWNQASRQEILCGLHRTRLSCAVSRDEGQTWANFKNLESLDDRSEIRPPPGSLVQVYEQFEAYGYKQPADTEHYFRAPGVLRICYPHVLFFGSEAIIVYDWGYGTLGDKLGTKLRAVPLQWFLESPEGSSGRAQRAGENPHPDHTLPRA